MAHKRRAALLAAVSAVGIGMVAAPLTAIPAVAAEDNVVQLNLININDFHGRIDENTVKFAGTIEDLKAEHPDSSLFLSAGDNVGASVFASATADDKPTIDVLNALGLKTSAVGNHEFDKGFDDLSGRIKDAADWTYLGANVYNKGTTTPALPEYATFDVDGVTVGVIGAVTQETPSLVSLGGIANLDFGDPVDAVNRVAQQLKDGNEANGEADVLVAEYHEGAAAGDAEGGTLENQVAAGGAFAKIVNDTSPEVNAIFTGHTHKAYAWDAPVAGGTRPVVQTGSYGANVGQIVLDYDTAAKAVTGHTQRYVKRSETDDATLVGKYPAVAEVKKIVDAALAAADEIGSQPVGSVAADITTAFSGGSYVNGVYTAGSVDENGLPTGRDDRGKESTLGNLVADSLVESLGSADRGGATIGVVNPGGLRSELYEAPDGVVTYAEANAVLPFVNNLWTTTLTGAQFKTALEQQWQTNPDGTPITNRPFLNLGLSSNVSYTYDATRAQGDHITSITVDGKPIDPAANYRIGSFSFLLEGGDNFRVFADGADTKDSGLIDRDAWIDYLKAHTDLAPSFARRGVQVTNVPASAPRGGTVSFDVKNLNLTSLGSPENTTLHVALEGGADLGDVKVSAGDPTSTTMANGTATVSFTVPDDAPDASTVVLTAAPSGTVVRVPLHVTAGAPSTPPTSAGESAQTPETEGGITVPDKVYHPGDSIVITVKGAQSGDFVSAWLWSTPQNLGGWLQVAADGTVTVTLPSTLDPGQHRLVVQDADGNVLGWTAITVQAAPSTGGGTGSGGAAGGTSANVNGGLASTGSDATPALLGASALLLLGAALVIAMRRRSRRA